MHCEFVVEHVLVVSAAIGMVGDERGLEPLLMALADDPSPLVRVRAVDGLGHFQQLQSIEALANLVSGETEDDLRLHAITAPGHTRSESAVAPLLRRLTVKSSRRERMAIADALALIGSSEAIDTITSELHGAGDAELRAHLTVALAATRDGDAFGSVVAMISDTSPAVRYVAIRGLQDLGRAEAALRRTRIPDLAGPSAIISVTSFSTSLRRCRTTSRSRRSWRQCPPCSRRQSR